MVWIVTILFLLITYFLGKKDLIWGVSWLTFMVISYKVRMSIFGVPTTALELGIYLLLILFLIKVYRGEIKLKWRSFYILPICWLVVGLISAVVVSDNKVASLGLWKGWILDPVLLFLIVQNSLKYKSQMKFIHQAFVFLMGMIGFLAIWQFATGTATTLDGRISTIFESANYLAMLMVPSLLFVLARFVKERKYLVYEIVFWILGLIALLLSASYIGLMGFLLGGLFLSWSIFTKNIKSFLYVILGGILLASVFMWLQPESDRFYKMIDMSQQSSVTVRVQVWEASTELIKENGVWGIGLGNFQEKYFNIIGSIFDPPMEWSMLHAHNVFIQSWLEMTLLGMILFITIILTAWNRAIKLIKKVDYYWLYGILAILLVWSVSGMLDTSYYKNDLSFIFWLMIALVIGTRDMYLRVKKS